MTVSQKLIENVKELRKSLNEISVYDFDVYTSMELYYKIANKLNEVIKELMRFEGLVSDEVVEQNEKLVYLLGEGLNIEVIKKINEMVASGQFEEIINNEVLYKIVNKLEDVENSLNNKASKNEVFSMKNMGQDIREAMTGGSVAVVGSNSVNTNNLVDNSVTREKATESVMNIYPFHPKAKFRHNKQTTPDSLFENEIRGLIKDIKLYNADIGKKYYINGINRDVNGSYYISIYNNDNIKVCEFNTNNFTETIGNIKVDLSTRNNSGIFGYAIVDWSAFPRNKGIYGMDYEETGLQLRVIQENDGRYLKDKSVDKTKVSDDVLTSYPFQPRASYKHDGKQYIEGIKTGVKDIHLFGADPSKKYAINIIYRNATLNKITSIHVVEVLNDNSIIKVCQGEIWNYNEPAGVDTFILNEINASGINGVCYIDWAKLPANTGYFNMKYDETGLDVRCIKQKIPNIEDLAIEIPKILLPSKLYATVGHELNVYFDTVIACDNVNDFKIDVEYNGEGGKQLNECFRVLPNNAGEYDLTIKVYKANKILISKKCKIVVNNDKNINTLRGIFIGDSLTEGNIYLAELQNMLPNFKSVGTRGDWANLSHEGRSGWGTTHYLNNENYLGKKNSFYNPSTETFDFNYYINTNNLKTPNFVTIALGTNDAGSINTDTFIFNLNKLITLIKAYDLSIKIGITIPPPPPSSQDGWGNKNKTAKTNWQHKKHMFEFTEGLLEEFDKKEGEGIYLLPIYLNIDTTYDFPYEEVQVSSRNTTKVKRCTENVHLSKEGYYKLSDIHYNWIKAIF